MPNCALIWTLNENENTTCQNVAKAVAREKFIALNVHEKEKELKSIT